VVQHVEEVARAVADHAEGIDALGVKRLLRGQDAVAAHRKLGDVGVLARVGGGAVGVARCVDAAVEDIKEAAAGDAGRREPDWRRRRRWAVRRWGQLARVVIDLKPLMMPLPPDWAVTVP
jgi:hypothetical protein